MNILVCVVFHFFVLCAADESNFKVMQESRQSIVQEASEAWLDEIPHLKLLVYPEKCLSAGRYAGMPTSKKAQLTSFVRFALHYERERIFFFYNALKFMSSHTVSYIKFYNKISQVKLTDADRIIQTVQIAEKYLSSCSMDDAIIMLNREAVTQKWPEYVLDHQWNMIETFTDLEKGLSFLPPIQRAARGPGICDTLVNFLRYRRDYLFLSPIRDDEKFFS